MKKLIAVLMIVFCASFAFADDLKASNNLTQKDMNDLAPEIGNIIYFNPGAPADPLGIAGFEVSVETALINIADDKVAWEHVTEDESPSYAIVFNKLRFVKGLPFNIDLGGYIGSASNSNISAWGVEARYALLEGTLATPAWTLRATYSKMTGVTDFGATTKSIEMMVSKGFLFVKPYANVALVSSTLEDKSENDLDDESETYVKYTGGVQFSPVPFFVINAELSAGETTNYYLKAGIRF